MFFTNKKEEEEEEGGGGGGYVTVIHVHKFAVCIHLLSVLDFPLLVNYSHIFL
jgi:hypothetical protein